MTITGGNRGGDDRGEAWIDAQGKPAVPVCGTNGRGAGSLALFRSSDMNDDVGPTATLLLWLQCPQAPTKATAPAVPHDLIQLHTRIPTSALGVKLSILSLVLTWHAGTSTR